MVTVGHLWHNTICHNAVQDLVFVSGTDDAIKEIKWEVINNKHMIIDTLKTYIFICMYIHMEVKFKRTFCFYVHDHHIKSGMEQCCKYLKISNISRTKSQNLNACCLSLQLSLRNMLKPSVKWRSADRRCSNYIWVINHLFAYQSASYIRDLTVADECL